MLVCYARELKEGFAAYAEEVVKLMVSLFKFYFHDGVRTSAAESLPYLLECAKVKGPLYVQGMWAYICPELLKAIDTEPEQDVLMELLYSLAKVSHDRLFRSYVLFRSNVRQRLFVFNNAKVTS